MTRRPPGLKPQYEDGLRDLAKGRGPNLRRLEDAIVGADDTTVGLKILTSGMASMCDSTARQRAQALWLILQEEVEKLGEEQDPKCHAALRAAFRIDMEAYRGAEYDTIEARLQQARSNGNFGPPDKIGKAAPGRAWGWGVWRLARAVEARLRELANHPEDWKTYSSNADPPAQAVPPPTAQPVLVDQLRATYVMNQRAVDYSVVERLITAQRDGVDCYIVRAGSPGGGPDTVCVRPLLNCRAATVRSVPDGRGGRTHEVSMLLPKPLQAGEQCFFATQVTRQQNEDPIVEIQVTSHGIVAGGLTMRVQFDEGSYPVAAWWFGDCIDAERLDKPSDGHPRRLAWSPYGLLQHTFPGFCKPLAKYGIGWEWKELSAAPRDPSGPVLAAGLSDHVVTAARDA